LLHQLERQMKTAIQKIPIKEQIIESGYVHIPFQNSSSLKEILRCLGTIIQTTEIRENSESTRLLTSNQPMTFHTDHHQARYIVWLCNSQSATGGNSLLVDSFSILKNFSASSLALLSEITIKTHHIFYGDKLTLPLIQLNEIGQALSIYYAEWLVNTPSCPKHLKALEKFQSSLKNVQPNSLLMSEGDILIIDNHRMLHARQGFPSKSNRWLTRYWLK